MAERATRSNFHRIRDALIAGRHRMGRGVYQDAIGALEELAQSVACAECGERVGLEWGLMGTNIAHVECALRRSLAATGSPRSSVVTTARDPHGEGPSLEGFGAAQVRERESADPGDREQ